MSEQGAQVDQEKMRKLREEIEQFHALFQLRHRQNYHLNWVLILVGLLLSAGVTIAGMLNYGVIAAIMGVGIGLLIGIQNAFPFSEKADFYRLVMSESWNLKTTLEYKVETNRQFTIVLNKFMKLRDHAAASLPKGQGMDAVRKMYEDLSADPGNV